MNLLNSLFDPDNKFTNFLAKIMYLAWLNLLWIICSLPVITIGASTTAVYYTVMRMARNEEGYIYKDFFHSFRENFKQSTIIWLITAAVYIMLGVNWYYFSSCINDFLRIFSFLFLSMLFIFSIISVYFFPVLSQFETGTLQLLRTCLYMSLKNIHWSFCLAVILWAGGLLVMLKFYPLMVFGFPLLAFAQAYIFNHIFRQYLPEGEFDAGTVATMQHTDKKNKQA